MIASLHAFIETLRRRGVAVSPAEAIDAARALEAVGPEDRAAMRTALGLTLAKHLDARVIFLEAFETFFVAPPRTGRTGRGRGRNPGDGGSEEAAIGTPGARGGSGHGRSSLRRDDLETPAPLRTGAHPPDAPPVPRRTASRPGLRALDPEQIRKMLASGAASSASSQRPAEAGARSRTTEPGTRRHEVGGTGPITEAKPFGFSRRGPAQPADAKDDSLSGRRRRTRLQRLLGSEPPAPGAAMDLRRRDLISPLTSAEERELSREIPRLIDEIRLRRGRRLRRAPRGRLWMKGTIREALRTGGVPFRLPAQARRPKLPRIILVVDVSWSVARASGLFLLLCQAFVTLGRRVRVFVFVDHPVDATNALRNWLRTSPPPAALAGRRGRAGGGRLDGEQAAEAGRAPSKSAMSPGAAYPRDAVRSWNPYASAMREHPARGRRGSRHGSRAHVRDAVAAGVRPSGEAASFRELLESLPGLNLEAPSDYGRAFFALESGALHAIPRDTILLVLGDGRTNAFDPLPWAFETIAERARRVIWLVPEPRARWGREDSALPRYLPFCDVAVEARDLEGLVHGVRELLSSIGRPS